MQWLIRRILFTVTIVLSAGFTQAQSPKLAPDIEALLQNALGPVDVVVQYHSAPGPLDLLRLQGLGGTLLGQFSILPAVAVRLPGVVVDLLALDPNVAYISPDRPVAPTLDLTTAAVGANETYAQGFTGAGVGVAILDSGIYPHPDLGSRIVYRESFVPGVHPDDYGHGTHVAGIVAGSGASSPGPQFTRTFRGVAPGANLIDLRVLDANGMSSDSIVLAAIDRAVALQGRYHIGVINLSLGRPIFESSQLDPICNAVAAAWKRGIVVVVAAGNLGRNGYATITSPGNSPYAITVGAMKTEGTPETGDDRIASYSSRGPTWID